MPRLAGLLSDLVGIGRDRPHPTPYSGRLRRQGQAGRPSAQRIQAPGPHIRSGLIGQRDILLLLVCLKSPVKLAAAEIGAALTSDAAWQIKCRDVPRPTKGHLLVFVGEDEQQARTAASGAASAGYQRTAVLQSGVHEFDSSSMAQVQQVIAHHIYEKGRMVIVVSVKFYLESCVPAN